MFLRLAFTEGKWFVLPLVLLIFVLGLINPLLGLVPLSVLIFVLYFFRDPQRTALEGSDLLLAACDGIVTGIKKIDCDFVGPDSWEVTVFMSPFNVHVNRAPLQGEVISSTHKPGRFMPAMDPAAPLENEKNVILIQGAVPVRVVQIAGIVARRVVSWVRAGQSVAAGEKIGMIKFSSCTQVVFPGNCQVEVKPGDKIQAGLTVIGRLP